MSMMNNLRAAWREGTQIDLALITGREMRGRVTQIEDSTDDLSDCATILFCPGVAETPFAIAVPHIMHIRVVDKENQFYTQAPRTVQGRM